MNPLDIRFDDIKLPDTQLHARIKNRVFCENMETLGDIVKWTEAEWMRVPGFAAKSLKELKNILAGFNLTLAEKPVKEPIKKERKYFMMCWKPISTAPKDNTIIILAGKDENGEWTVEPGHWETYNFWQGDEEMTPGWSWSEDTAPTHWMHLPDPPEGD